MPWNDTARVEHRRDCARYPSDLTDREWGLIEPLLPAARPGGRPRTTDMRAVVEAILYIAASGCQWRMLPKDFPPVSTVQGYFYDWRDSALWPTINQLLVMSARELEGWEARHIDIRPSLGNHSGMDSWNTSAARHGRAIHFSASGLFSGLTSFAELEQRIADLPTKQERGDAFEVFAEAYLATQKVNQAAEVWPHDAVPISIADTLGALPE